jgi:hypothetical protein
MPTSEGDRIDYGDHGASGSLARGSMAVAASRRLVASLVIVALIDCACTHKTVTAPTPPVNQNPLIASLVAFPDIIGPSDSMIVVCEAGDPDGDALVYDWFTDSRFTIQGNVPSDHELYGTTSDAHVFYRNYVDPADTSAWVQCIVRDLKGGQAGRVVVVRVHS